MLDLDSSSSIVYRHVQKHEEKEALDLWCPVFKHTIDHEGRYFLHDASPCYQEGDTLGAWHNDQLVSTIHIRRFLLQCHEDNKKYLCAGITNVVTRNEYQRKGLSRHLLQMVIDKFNESNDFDISILGTGKPDHFARFGWEEVPRPMKIIINWTSDDTLSKTNVQWHSVSNLSHENIELLFDIHSNNPRIYQMERSPRSIFYHWVKFRWQIDEAIVCLYEKGYVVIGSPDNDEDICILEWRAPNKNSEQKLLSLAASEIRQRHGLTKHIQLFALPQYMTIDELTEWAGSIQIGTSSDIMMRNIRLSSEIYHRIKTSFSNGRAVFWSGDYF